jgi:capsular polysaccharide biosynthesis protein
MSDEASALRTVDAALRDIARRRVLADRGYRLRWWYGFAVLTVDVIFVSTFPLVAYAEWLIYAGPVLVLANLAGRLVAPPLNAPPTSDRLAAERVLTISTRPPEST